MQTTQIITLIGSAPPPPHGPAPFSITPQVGLGLDCLIQVFKLFITVYNCLKDQLFFRFFFHFFFIFFLVFRFQTTNVLIDVINCQQNTHVTICANLFKPRPRSAPPPFYF